MVNPSDDAGFVCWMDCLEQQEWQGELSLVRLCEGCVSRQRIDSMIKKEMGWQRISVVAELPQ